MKTKIITVATLIVIAFGILTLNKKCNSLSSDPYLRNVDTTEIVNSSPSIQMYFFIKKYADKYDIPEAYAFSLAYQETRYQGPLDLKYNHKQKSYAGALGPMQIMPGTANHIWGRNIPKGRLISDIDLNVETSMKLLRKLHDKYKDWKLVFGCYNTGRPCINDYAIRVYNFKPNIQ